jgi:hypothetical protein
LLRNKIYKEYNIQTGTPIQDACCHILITITA